MTIHIRDLVGWVEPRRAHQNCYGFMWERGSPCRIWEPPTLALSRIWG